jgi:hypothetical protein
MSPRTLCRAREQFSGAAGLSARSSACRELTPFFRATIVGRIFVLRSLLTLWLGDAVPGQMLVFGMTDFTFAAWTFLALRRDAGARRVGA